MNDWQAVLAGTLPWALIRGRSAEVLSTFPDNSIDAVVADPPSGIEFMNKDWDCFRRAHNPADVGRPNVFGRTSRTSPHSYGESARGNFVAFIKSVMAQAFRVLKPGGHAFIWALPRTAHWTTWAIEDAGFEVRDVIDHVFLSGFPKGINISKQLDKKAGVKPVEVREASLGFRNDPQWHALQNQIIMPPPTTDAAKKWEGWNVALKPSREGWILARKPSRILDEINAVLARLEAMCLPLAESAVGRSTPSHHGFVSDEAITVRGNVPLPLSNAGLESSTVIGAGVVSSDPTATSRSGSMDDTVSSIVLSWKQALVAASNLTNTFTTETESSLIIDLRTLNFLLSRITRDDITRVVLSRSGPPSRAVTALHLFAAFESKLRAILAFSAIAHVGSPADTSASSDGVYRAGGGGLTTAPGSDHENWILARKPLEGTVLANVQKWGVGGINIGACRVDYQGDEDAASARPQGQATSKTPTAPGMAGQPDAGRELERVAFDPEDSDGRWPAHLLLSHGEQCFTCRGCCAPFEYQDNPGEAVCTNGHSEAIENIGCVEGCPVRELDRQSGVRKSGTGAVKRASAKGHVPGALGKESRPEGTPMISYGDTGGASRCFTQFFYTPKPPRSEKEKGCEHLTPKTPEELTGRKSGSAGLVMAHTDGSPKANPYAGTSGAEPRRNHHPCLRPGSLVLTEYGWYEIGLIAVGDRVLGADGALHTVADVSHHHCEGPLYRVVVEGGAAAVDATHNHPFLVLRDGCVMWVEAQFLLPGDFTLTPENALDTVKSWEGADPKASTRAGTVTRPRRATIASGTRGDSEWPTSSCGRTLTGQSQTGSGSTTRTRTSRTIACPTSRLSMPLHTSGCTPVASYETVRGGSHAGCAVCSSPSPKNTGTSPAKDGSLTGDADLATSRKFALHRVESVEPIPYDGPVWNLTVEDSPTFQTQVGMSHNTVKSIALMRWLVRLITPPGGVVVDMFAGSGTTGVACMEEGFRFVGIEKDEDKEGKPLGYVDIARARLKHARPLTIQEEADADQAAHHARESAADRFELANDF